MRLRSILVLISLLSLAVSAWSQTSVPAPALSKVSSNSNDVAVSGIVLVRDNANTGLGGDVALTHYFMKYLGFTGEADLLKSNYVELREYGFRGGPTFRLFPSSRFQPFARGLFGYSRYKETVTGPNRPYINGFSYILGGGTDIVLVGPLSARLSGDFEDDPSFVGNKTRLLRFGFGLKYSFGIGSH